MQKLCIFTGTRAEYGLLKPLLKVINDDPELTLQILATGTHLSKDFGLTVQEIERDGFRVDEKIEILMSSDSTVSVCKSVGLGLISYSEALQRLDPEVLIVLGDRYEALAAAVSAMIIKIPIAHIHGGESTYGLIDEAIRHSITKMAYYHFTSTESYRNRVIQLGEHPKRVFNVGALGIDNITNLTVLDRKDLERMLDFKFGQDCMIITYHPVTLEEKTATTQFRALLDALDAFPNFKKIFTKSNADAGGREINETIDDYVRHNRTAVAFHSLGQTKYLNVLKHMKCIVGNSSSGIIEAPSLKVATVNIGDRQAGRIRCDSVVDCMPEKEPIIQAIETALSDEFQHRLNKIKNPYEKKNTAALIVEKLTNMPTPQNLKKGFFDVPLSL